ncbi:hypothetical protein ACIF83_41075 [Streptomyces sp. NPDC085866]|uniref:hypothetical protein n=1 Tax=Streptomyces sp. NPDC085866 TaxID=3365736 RepID=UPI0037D94EF1
MQGAEAAVDFGDVTIRLAGEQIKVILFAMRLSYSGKAVHRIFAPCGQEAFFEGHVHARSVLCGVPTDKVRYDNVGLPPGSGRRRSAGESLGQCSAERSSCGNV